MRETGFNYDKGGKGYSSYRRPDPHIAKYVHAALGDARTVLNVGAGAGSYEPLDRYVAGIEPSALMRAQRPANLSPAINATAENIPFDDNSFDAGMAMITVHHWPDPVKGLSEMRRVCKGPIVILTFDPAAVTDFWIADYAPEIIAVDRMRYQTMDWFKETLGGKVMIQKIPVTIDCVDGFQEAFYARPEIFLDEGFRRAQSTWSFLAEGQEEEIVKRIADDLESGEWERKYGYLRSQPEFTGALRLITAMPS